MPAARRMAKTSTPKDVPDPGDPERKRVLNVLAQRRYRQRRREKIAALEAQAKGLTPPESLGQPQNETVDIDLCNGARNSSNSVLEESGTVEEVERDLEDIGFLMLDFNQDPVEFNVFQNFELSNLPSPLPSTPSPSSTPLLLAQPISHIPQSAHIPHNYHTPPAPTFPLTPDGAVFQVPHLAAIRAFSTIATALNVVSHVYNPTYLHVLSPFPSTSSLPANIHPTLAQLTIPHHPIFDILPWPSVREKLICMLALPSALRPPIAWEDESGDGDGSGGMGQGKAVVRVLQDLDDYNEGVRVHGLGVGFAEGNELVEESWEIGEVFYRNWWWCLDSKVVGISNRRRRERGVDALRLKS